MKQHNPYDVCVVGGGYMGAAVAMGLAKSGASVLMLDKTMKTHKASRANFGLVWSQSKGAGNRPYSRLSEKAVRAFEDFAGGVEAESGIDIELRLGGGLILCLGEQELAARGKAVAALHREAEQCGETHPSRLLDRNEVRELVGKATLGEAVSGASFSPIDGDVNPLLLLRAMRQVFLKNGGQFLQGCQVRAIRKTKAGYLLETDTHRVEAAKLVLAAGLGNLSLMEMIGRKVPLIPQKGQLLVTEKVRPFLPLPMSGMRQTGCGSVMIGYSQENTGIDTETSVSVASALAARAIRTFPGLRHTRIVRSWAALRVLTADGLPIYDEIKGCPGAYVLATHSCVTLSPIHATLLPSWILDGNRPDVINHFILERFDV